MDTALWIMAGVLAAAYLAGGTALLVLGRERYRSLGRSQHWVDDFSAGHLKVIGITKVAGAVGLVLPAAVGLWPELVPLAACGLMLVMAGAATTRFRRSEWVYLVGDVVYLVAFGFLTWGRLVAEPFA